MKLIIAVVEPETLNAIQQAIREPEAYLLYVNQIGDLRNPVTLHYRGSAYHEPRARLRVEIVVVNEMVVEETIDAISRAASTCASGQAGQLFVIPLDEWVRIPAASSAPAATHDEARSVAREVLTNWR